MIGTGISGSAGGDSRQVIRDYQSKEKDRLKFAQSLLRQGRAASRVAAPEKANITATSVPSRRRFLEMVLPWPNGAKGFINVHVNRDFIDKNTGAVTGRGWTGKPCVDVLQFEQIVEKEDAWTAVKPDVYHCMSRQAEIGTTRTGNVKAVKHAKDALALKAIWLDIDVGKVKNGKPDPKCYATLKDMQDALIKFQRDANLPAPSAIVASGGGGWHVYWASTTELDPITWKGYAQGLKALVLQHGFLATRTSSLTPRGCSGCPALTTGRPASRSR